VFRVHCNANARARRKVDPVHPNGFSETIGEIVDSRLNCASVTGYQNCELVATDSTDNGRIGNGFPNSQRDIAQKYISGAVAEAIVYDLEAIDVDKQNNVALGATGFI